MTDYLAVNEWTAGAQRAVKRSAQLATWLTAAEVEPLHVLVALVLDEGRAAGRLLDFGLDHHAIRHHLAETNPVWPEDWSTLSALLPFSRATSTILQEAESLSRRLTGGVEVGTEHLLWTLVHIASPAADVLAAFGLTPATFEQAAVLDADTTPQSVPDGLQLAPRDPGVHIAASDLWRLLDASANRVREAFRVLEDFARFVLNDAFLSRELKTARHELAEIMTAFPALALLAARDTLGDVGTHIGAAAEYERARVADVLTAAFKRAQEALRSLEEYGKVFDGGVGRRFESLRYRLYTLEKALLRTQENRDRLADQRLYLLLTESLCPLGGGRVLHEALAGGVGIVQVREKTMTDRQLIAHCRDVRKWTRERGVLMIVNDRADVAVLVDADGIHVGQEELTVAEARQIVGPDRLIGVSTHSLDQARQAVLDGADYLGVGPVFSTETKAFDALPGLDLVQQVAAEIALPWYAIGGINEENIGSVAAVGATRIAVSAAICRAHDPRAAAATLQSWLD